MSAPSDRITELSNQLIELPEAIGRTVAAHGGQFLAVSGSTAHLEIEGQGPFVGRSEHPVLDAFSHVHVRLLGSMQNLVAIGHLLATGPIDPPIGVLARATLESAAMARWLLDQPENTRVRIARGRALQLHELQEDAAILRGVSQDDAAFRILNSINSGVEEIAADCNEVGIPADRSRRGRAYIPEEPVPSATSAVEELVGEEGVITYRVLCGSTHGSLSAALASMTEAPFASGLDGVKVMMTSDDPSRVMPLLGVVMQGYYRANNLRFQALGWTPTEWLTWLRRTMPMVIELSSTESG